MVVLDCSAGCCLGAEAQRWQAARGASGLSACDLRVLDAGLMGQLDSQDLAAVANPDESKL